MSTPPTALSDPALGATPETPRGGPPGGVLDALTDLVRRLERGGLTRPATGEDRAHAYGAAPAAVATGWPGLDGRLGTLAGAPGLARGALHEWIGLVDPHEGAAARGPWSPPLTLLAHLAARALEERLARGGGHERSGSVLWVGRAVWPYAATLLAVDALREVDGHDEVEGRHDVGRVAGERPPRAEAGPRDERDLELELALDERPCDGPVDERALFARSLWIDPADAAGRLWAVDAALRCATVTAVVADATGFDMAASRRLSLAAQAGEALALLARPPHEERELSAAATRWRVTRTGASLAPRWRLALLRAKPPQRRDAPSWDSAPPA